MGYLGIDIGRAQELATTLRAAARQIEPTQRLVTDAQVLSDLSVQVTMPLDQIRSDYERSAAQISRSIAVVNSFQLHLAHVVFSANAPMPTRTPTPVVPADVSRSLTATSGDTLWNAGPNMSWNEVSQVSSHNSYAVAGGVSALFDLGVRSFELDIHRDPPASPASFVRRAFGAANGRSDTDPDWRVYHRLGDSHSEYEYLSDGLAAVAALETSDPLTIFIDNKDPFSAGHSVEAFDQLIEATFGDRLYRPAEMLERASPDRVTLDGVGSVDWPTVDELDGRVIVVLTDNVDGYVHAGSAAFVAPAPNVQRGANELAPVSAPGVVFYNESARRLEADEIAAIQASNSIVRSYFNPRCDSIEFGTNPPAANYRAVDIEPGQPGCGPTMSPAAVDTPVPLPPPAGLTVDTG